MTGHDPAHQLRVLETAERILVIDCADNDDWILCFYKNADFSARDWAENVVAIYNEGRPATTADGVGPVGFARDWQSSANPRRAAG